jgi:hypothetical protein
MMPAIEVRMMLDTDEGILHVNFFTALKKDIDDDNFFSELDYKLQTVFDTNDDITNSGHAIISHMGTELFTVYFMRDEEGVGWTKKIMMNENDPVIH